MGSMCAAGRRRPRRPSGAGRWDHLVLAITHGLADAEQFSGLRVPFGCEIAHRDDHAIRFLPASHRLLVLKRLGPGFSQVGRSRFVGGVEDVAAGEQQLLHGEHDGRRAAGNGAGAWVDPAGLAVIALVDDVELNA